VEKQCESFHRSVTSRIRRQQQEPGARLHKKSNADSGTGATTRRSRTSSFKEDRSSIWFWRSEGVYEGGIFAATGEMCSLKGSVCEGHKTLNLRIKELESIIGM
jgi:hypothetical protein